MDSPLSYPVRSGGLPASQDAFRDRNELTFTIASKQTGNILTSRALVTILAVLLIGWLLIGLDKTKDAENNDRAKPD